MQQVLVFKLGKEYLACGVEIVEEIIQYQDITSLPNTDFYIEGVTNVRGNIYPVISLAKRLGGYEESEIDKSTRIVIIKVDDISVGMIVDDVTEVLKVDESMLEPPPPLVRGGSESALQGILKDSDRLISLIDMAKITDRSIDQLALA
jgi:purine-binding chemotaxis protein CheW